MSLENHSTVRRSPWPKNFKNFKKCYLCGDLGPDPLCPNCFDTLRLQNKICEGDPYELEE